MRTLLTFFACCLLLAGCGEVPSLTVTVTNPLPSARAGEMIELPLEDIARALGTSKRNDQLLVGFALETDNETANAEKKLKGKNLDFIVLNSLRDKGAGFKTDTNKITIIGRKGTEAYPLKSKREVAADIVDTLESYMHEKK